MPQREAGLVDGQQVKAPAAKPDDLSLIPGTDRTGANLLPGVLLCSAVLPWYILSLPQTHKINE